MVQSLRTFQNYACGTRYIFCATFTWHQTNMIKSSVLYANGSLLRRFMSFFTPLSRVDATDNCLVSVCHFGDELYALTETNVMRKIDPETLETLGEKVSSFLDNYSSLAYYREEVGWRGYFIPDSQYITVLMPATD